MTTDQIERKATLLLKKAEAAMTPDDEPANAQARGLMQLADRWIELLKEKAK